MERCEGIKIRCIDCGQVVDEIFYKVQIVEHKTSEMLARGRLIQPFILCAVCVIRPTKPVQIPPEITNASR